MWPEDAFSLPARDGYDVGGAQERAMSARVDGYGGIRETYEVNPDGSVTTLRTRLGWPAFETTARPSSVCLQSPLTEWGVGPGHPVDMFILRAWHDERDPLISSDGLITIARRPLRAWSAKLKNGALVESHFSTPAGMVDTSAMTASAHQFIEEEWATRTWHALQDGIGGTLRLFFSVRRLAELHLRYRGAPFVWLFSSEVDAKVAAPEPACINHSGFEGGIETREAYSNAQLKQAGIIINSRLGLLRFAEPGGFLGSIEGPPVVGRDPLDLRSATNTYLSDLSDSLALGQAWHGWAYAAGIETAIGVRFPEEYDISGGSVAYTDYVAIPDLPEPSSDLPYDFVDSGKSLYKDAILFGETKKYSPLSSVALGPNRWVHHSATQGVSILRVEPVGVVGQENVTLQIWRDGVWTVNGLEGTPVLLGEAVIHSNITPNDIARTCPEKAWFVSGQTGIGAIAYYTGPYGIPPQQPNTVSLNQSPSGKKIAVCHYVMGKQSSVEWNEWTTLRLTSAWEMYVSDEYLCVAEERWQLADTSMMTGYTMIYWEYVSRDRIKTYNGQTFMGYPTYSVSYTVGLRGPYFRGSPHPDTEELLMSVYNGTEDLKLIKLVSEYPMDFGKYATIDVAEPYAGYPYYPDPLLEWQSDSVKPMPGYPWADIINEETPMPFGTPFKAWDFLHVTADTTSPYYSPFWMLPNYAFFSAYFLEFNYSQPTRYRITIGDVPEDDYVFTDSFVSYAPEPYRSYPALYARDRVLCSNNVNLLWFYRQEDSIPERVLFITPNAVEDVTDKFIDGTITVWINSNSSNVTAAFNPRTKQLRWQTNGEIFTAI